MPNTTKQGFLKKLSEKYGSARKLGSSLSLYELGDGAARIYIRYSKLHSRNQGWYGLREADLKELEGRPSVICFLWENQTEPLFVPFAEYEDVFQSTTPADDGQYKAMVYLKDSGTDFYVAGAGRFNVDAYFGWEALDVVVDSTRLVSSAEFSHSQMQTFLGAIGISKGYDVWIPQIDRSKLEWTLANRFDCRDVLPYGFEQVTNILQEVDVIWIERGSTNLRALFEAEHSTPIYSGLLRFNDIHLVSPSMRPGFSIVANDSRRVLFVKQINRPTFQMSGLGELCTFFEYADVARWHDRIKSKWTQENESPEQRT